MDTLERNLLDLKTLMEMQIQGMDHFQDTQLAAKAALQTKTWPALEKALQSLDFQSEGLRCLEERRDALWRGIQLRVLGREGKFYEVLPRLPEDQRELLAELFRELKLRSLRLKGLNLGIATYVQTASALVKAVVHELNPTLRGRMYSRSGFIRGGEARPLVLNTHF
ncbi:MAG: hypothetical protein WCG80_02440 [Spirochaetales bacterium]